MSRQRIAAVEYELPEGLAEYISIDSDLSLLDWDIVLFSPDTTLLATHYDTYMGKPVLPDDGSFQFRERMEHWRGEISDALDRGKTVIVFLREVSEVYIDTGLRQYSGTGRNRQTTVSVEPYDNYRCLPISLKLVNSRGSSMRLAKRGQLLSDYWSDFGDCSSYRVRIEGKVTEPLVVTKAGDKTVGALIRLKDSTGALLLLPYLDMGSAEFRAETSDGDLTWTKRGEQSARRLVEAIVQIDRTLRQSGAATPTPQWAKKAEFSLPKEAPLRAELLKVDAEIEKLQQQRQKAREQLAGEGVLRRLLFEKGTPLEDSILLALALIGFSAKRYKDSESEFDAVFESPEGRFLGEAEGRDNNPIGIDKLRQLEMNINEDFAREEVLEPATGVLFGNAYRLAPLGDRSTFFTEKCLKAAQRSGTVLVRTPDLFRAARYLSGQADAAYAQECREAMLNSRGKIVQFPEPPQVSEAGENVTTALEDTHDDSVT